ncbi:AhpC/TSA family protein [Pedobacter frigiditerrae]|uniref:AhpC/TSA family protein n=1 Tax=Pedobacter frigiditerrae TaxID=2530452 RepID=A0A4R0N3J1_9SPHI|nr:TlpA disulfide reductase family protein [Pedobacter frigiditerrae]TCC94438.1 AhpC/TSA family protein [Pedobacter frigiditerrae]
MMTNLKNLSILFMLSISSVSAIAQTFNITGQTTGIDDGTWLYLRTSSPEKTLDSTKVINGRFKLVGKTNEKVSHLAIYTAKYENYLFFWAEQNTHLQLKNGEFKKGIITGSKTQTQTDLRNKLKEPNRKLQDSLSQLLAKEKDIATKKELKEKLNTAKNAEKELDIKDVRDNPNSLISAYILSVYASTWGKEKSAELYNNLSSEMKNTTYGKTINDFINLNQEIKIGGKFADFEQANTADKKIKLSGIKAKYILLEFWGSWCGPCREENPNLVKTYNAYKDKGFEILGVAADDKKEQWLKAIKDDHLPWENVSDLKGDKNEAALIYGISAYPTNFLIDEKGIIIAKNLRGDALSKKLAELLP